jgi:hypothetical protein
MKLDPFKPLVAGNAPYMPRSLNRSFCARSGRRAGGTGQEGSPALESHSAALTLSYQRMFDRDLIEGLAALIRSSASGERTAIAIDGRGASGKTTLALQLAAALADDADVLGVDSFFVPLTQPSPREGSTA